MWALCVVRSKQPLHPLDDERQRDGEDKQGEGHERFTPGLHGSLSSRRERAPCWRRLAIGTKTAVSAVGSPGPR